MNKEYKDICLCNCCYEDGKYKKDLSVLFLRLEERVKTVRTSRIYASKRLKKDHLFYQKVTIFFSIISTLLAIFFIGVDAESIESVIGESRFGDLNSWLLVIATYVTLVTLYSSIRNPGEKIGMFKSNYMELTELLHEIQLFNKRDIKKQEVNKEQICDSFNYIQSAQEYKRLSKVYAALLTQIENHEDIDYSHSIIYLEDRCCKDSKESRTKKLKGASQKILYFQIIDCLKKVVFALSLPLLICLIYLVEYASNYGQVVMNSLLILLIILAFVCCLMARKTN